MSKTTLRLPYKGFKITIIDTDDSYWCSFRNPYIQDNTERFNDRVSAIDAAHDMIDKLTDKVILCVAATHNSAGERELVPVKLRFENCKDVEEGNHYEAVINQIGIMGYKMKGTIVFDQWDNEKLMEMFNWDNEPEIKLEDVWQN